MINITEALDPILRKLGGAQPAEGTWLDDTTWVWIYAFCDFDYEYSYLVQVRSKGDDKTLTRHLAIFQGYDAQGIHVVRHDWHDGETTDTQVPDLYTALSWWAAWVPTVRGEQ